MPQPAVRPARAAYEADHDLPPLREVGSDDSLGSVFDHEGEAPRGRRRPAHDWGADELFTQMPQRRFDHAAARSRHLELVPDAPAAETPTAAEAAVELPEPPASAPLEPAEPGIALDVQDELELAATEPAEPVAEPAPAGRRTVTITGHPGATAPTPRAARRRPPRTFHERLGARPDRIAGWACGLGFLLILVAVSTADAAPL